MKHDEKSKLVGDHKLSTKEMLKKNFQYLKPEWRSFLLAAFLIILNVILDIILPLVLSEVTKILKMDTIDIKLIIAFAVGYFILTIVNQVFMYFESMILQKSGQRIIYSLRMDVFSHIENMSLNQFNEMPVGSLVTRVANYTQSMSDLFTNVFVNIIRNILTAVGVYAMMIYISPLLSLILLPVVVLVFFISYFFSKVVSKIFKKETKVVSSLNTVLNENLSGMKIIQIFNREIKKREEFSVKNNELRKVRYKFAIAFGIYRPTISFLYFVAIAITFGLGIQCQLNANEIVAFYLLLSRFFNPIQNLADQLNNLQKALSSCERLFNLLNTKPDVVDLPDAIKIDKFEGKIEFRHVWLAYEEENWILKDVSFVINPKETCAFVGATGAGKTTILSLIVKNFEPQKGEILIDDINIKNIQIKSLRKAIGQMLQDVFLFSGTVKSNITLNDDSYTDEEIQKTCDYVNASSFINKFPKKLDEEILQRGDNLSCGQRQLLSFARVVISKPQILILDEATANIDTETEVVIQDSLKKIKTLGTMLIVAHRLSTIQHSDQIVVLQNGRVVEKGNHQELLKNKGYYYKLYKLQFDN